MTFLEDGNVVLEWVWDATERHGSVKMNIAFNDEFTTNDKRANKSIITKNSEIYWYTDMREWYEQYILASLEEFQERDSGWAFTYLIQCDQCEQIKFPARGITSKCHGK